MVDGDVVMRILLAVGLGAAIGAEREGSGQAAGLRTHVTVALGAALFGVISTLGFESYEARRETTNIQVDVTRIASQVVVGIGFLGAGLIVRRRGEVWNLTTAASLWVTAAIGLAAGVGALSAAAVATVALLLALVALRPLRVVLQRRVARQRTDVTIRLREGARPEDFLAALDAVGGRDGVAVTSVGKEAGCYVLLVAVEPARGADMRPVLRRLADLDVVDAMRSSELG